jgi:hypothetical protein
MAIPDKFVSGIPLDSLREGVAQYQRPRPYQPPPPSRNTIRTMIRSVVISM